MNARDAKRIVLWMNGHYLIAADHHGLSDGEASSLGDDDLARLESAQIELGQELIRRSGIDGDLDPREILSFLAEGRRGIAGRAGTDGEGREHDDHG